MPGYGSVDVADHELGGVAHQEDAGWRSGQQQNFFGQPLNATLRRQNIREEREVAIVGVLAKVGGRCRACNSNPRTKRLSYLLSFHTLDLLGY